MDHFEWNSRIALIFFGYIDPGAGSIVLQVLIAGFVGTLFAIKVFIKDLKIFFRKLFIRK